MNTGTSALTLTLSHPLEEGTAVDWFRESGCAFGGIRSPICRETVSVSPSPIGWERAGVRVR